MIKKILLIGFILMCHFIATEVEAKPKVYVVNYPLQYFAQRIGGDLIEVKFPAPPNVDPAHWVPDLKTIQDYQKADLILLNGAGYAKWVSKVSLPRSKLKNTSVAFKQDYLPLTNTPSHRHGPEGQHSHGPVALTTWLNFSFAAQQAEAVKDALVQLIPLEQERLEANFQTLKKELLALDRQLKEITAAAPNKLLLASHPVYQYLAKRYAIAIHAFTWEPEVLPTAQGWGELDDYLKKHPVQWMLWEGQPLEKIQNELQKRGVATIVFDPCGNKPPQGDFLSVMKENIKRLSQAY